MYFDSGEINLIISIVHNTTAPPSTELKVLDRASNGSPQEASECHHGTCTLHSPEHNTPMMRTQPPPVVQYT